VEEVVGRDPAYVVIARRPGGCRAFLLSRAFGQRARRSTLRVVGTQNDLDALAALLASSPSLTGVPRSGVRDLAAQGSVRRYRRGTYLCHQGDDATDVFFLVRGRVEVSGDSATGTRVYHATVDTPQFLGELGPLGDMPRTASVLALVDAEVWVAPAEAFLKLVAGEPEAARALMRALARQVQVQQAFAEDLLFLDLKGRVAKRLLQLVTEDLDELPDDGVVVPEVTQADLASLCGGSRENVTRILKEFERRDLVHRDGHRYVLRKIEPLAKLAEL
jgi:CRP/FNR family transcriptional regulator, cyclic AMP receptor protein